MPEQMTLRLSDSFQKAGDHNTGTTPALEVIAQVFNVNYGKNQLLMERCRRLFEYSYLIHQVRHYTHQGYVLEAAMEQAIEDCIQQNILKEFLIKHREEVCNVILTKYDEAFHIQCEKELSYEEGREEGRVQGRAEGRVQGREEGRAEGSYQTRRKMILFLSSSGVDRQIICQSASITEDELEAILQGAS